MEIYCSENNWVYTYIFGFILLLSVVLVHLIDALYPTI